MVWKTPVLKTAQKHPVLDTKSAIERARRLQTARNLIVVVRLCSLVVLSYLDAAFEAQCLRKDFLIACCRCCLLLPLLPCGLSHGIQAACYVRMLAAV